MSAQNRQNLKALFETGDTITQQSMENLVDSFISIVDTTAQNLASNLTVPNLATNTVSAGAIYSDNFYCVGYVLNQNPYFEGYVPLTAIASVATSATWVEVPALLSSVNNHDISVYSTSENKIQYNAFTTANVEISFNMSMKVGASKQMQFGIFKNGNIIVPSQNKMTTFNDSASNHMIQCVTELKNSDIVDLRLYQEEGTLYNVEFHNLNVVVSTIQLG